jgi:hypothetical protein
VDLEPTGSRRVWRTAVTDAINNNVCIFVLFYFLGFVMADVFRDMTLETRGGRVCLFSLGVSPLCLFT